MVLCKHYWCQINAKFGYPDLRISEYCIRHKKYDMVNLCTGCILCNMNRINYKLCTTCKNKFISDNIPDFHKLSELIILQYIKCYYDKPADDNSFKILISLCDEITEDKLKLLEKSFGVGKVILIIINFDITPYYESVSGNLKKCLISILLRRCREICDVLESIHSSATIFGIQNSSRIIYV